MRSTELATLLQSGARARYAEEAAVDLLVEHGTWLTRTDFIDSCVTVDAPVRRRRGRVRRLAAPRSSSLDHGELPCSTSEASILRIAAGLAGVPVDLRAMLGGLDARNIRLVAQAVMHANGTPAPHAVIEATTRTPGGRHHG